MKIRTTVSLTLSVTMTLSLPVRASEPQEILSSRVETGNAGRSGAIYYQLPKNYFRFQFNLKTTKTAQGSFCDLAPYFFILSKPLTCDKPEPVYDVSLSDQFSVEELGEPDPSAAFDITIPKGGATESNLALGFGDGGSLSNFQSSVTDHKVDFVFAILKTAANVVGGLLHPNLLAARSSQPTAASLKVLAADCAESLGKKDKELFNAISPARRDEVCAMNPKFRSFYLNTPDPLKAYVDTYVADGGANLQHFFDALELFREYRDIVNDDATFLRPDQLPKSPDAFAGVLKSREDRKKAIVQQFTVNQTDSVDPVPEVVWRPGVGGGDVELFSFVANVKDPLCFRKQTGKDDVWQARAGDVPECPANADGLVSVGASLIKDPESATSAGLDSSGKDQGLAYRVPGRGTLTVYLKYAKAPRNTETKFDYFRKAYDIAQMGTIKCLPAKLGNSTSYNVTLDPVTGALRGITLGAKPVLSDQFTKQVDDLGTAVLGAVNAVNAAKAAGKKPSELDNAQAERQLKAEGLRIQLIEGCKSDPTQPYCVAILPTLIK